MRCSLFCLLVHFLPPCFLLRVLWAKSPKKKNFAQLAQKQAQKPHSKSKACGRATERPCAISATAGGCCVSPRSALMLRALLSSHHALTQSHRLFTAWHTAPQVFAPRAFHSGALAPLLQTATQRCSFSAAATGGGRDGVDAPNASDAIRVDSLEMFDAKLRAVEAAGRSRIKRERVLRDYFLSLLTHAPQAVVPVVAMLTNQLKTSVEGHKDNEPVGSLRFGRGTVFRALDRIFEGHDQLAAYSNSEGSTGAQGFVKEHCGGDVGLAFALLAESSSSHENVKHALQRAAASTEVESQRPLTVSSVVDVYDQFMRMGSAEGQFADAVRTQRLYELLYGAVSECNDLRVVESLLRLATGERLRLGVADVSIINALSSALVQNATVDCAASDAHGHADVEKPVHIDKASVILTLGMVFKACPCVHTFLGKVQRAVSLSTTGPTNALSSLAALHPQVVVGKPFQPMLALAAKSTDEALASIQKHFSTPENSIVACDFKYDGMRAQLHVDVAAGTVQIFTRSLDDVTKQFEALVQQLKAVASSWPMQARLPETSVPGDKTSSFVLDGEIVMVDRVAGHVRSFSDFMNRKGRTAAETVDDESQEISFVAFDILHCCGTSTSLMPFSERRQILTSIVPAATPDGQGYKQPIFSAETVAVSVPAVAQSSTHTPNIELSEHERQFHDSIVEVMSLSRRHFCDGVVVKAESGVYDYGGRRVTDGWLKLKHDFVNAGQAVEASDCSSTSTLAVGNAHEYMADSLDLIVLGAYFGRGRRREVLGSFLMGAFDESRDVFETVCKVCMLSAIFFAQVLAVQNVHVLLVAFFVATAMAGRHRIY